MKITTQTVLVFGIIQCIILTLFLILFMQYQRSLKSGGAMAPDREVTAEPGINRY